ncbi:MULTISPECIES: hypothetical protein [unclassified Streptomyces]
MANRPLARRTQLAGHHYWLLSVLGAFLPTAALMANSICLIGSESTMSC